MDLTDIYGLFHPTDIFFHLLSKPSPKEAKV